VCEAHCRFKSVESLLAYAADHADLSGMGHRTAAIEDSRLLPLSETTIATMPND